MGDEKIRVQYEEMVKLVAVEDFPERWPVVVPQLTAVLQSN
jgi:hypothetical protein